VVRLLPPLNFTREQADTVVAMLSELILEFLARGVAAQPAAA
jgi:4-aminobutyrate aminotransferase-like enzyme